MSHPLGHPLVSTSNNAACSTLPALHPMPTMFTLVASPIPPRTKLSHVYNSYVGLRAMTVLYGVDGAVLWLPYPCRCRSGQLPRWTVDGADSNRPILSQYARQRHWTALEGNVRTKLNQQLDITPQRWLFSTQLASIEGVASDCLGFETEQTDDYSKYGSARASAPPPNAPPCRHPACLLVLSRPMIDLTIFLSILALRFDCQWLHLARIQAHTAPGC
jgi:hypothetical protein